MRLSPPLPPQKGKVLKKKGAARLYIERNLYEDFCRDGNYSTRNHRNYTFPALRLPTFHYIAPLAVPDLHIEGTLSAIHVMLDKPQLELIKGLIDMNLGEEMEDFEKPSTVIIDPIAQVRGDGGGEGGWRGGEGGWRGGGR